MTELFKSIASYTRPNPDTTQYTVGDALSDSASAPTALAFSGIPKNAMINEVLITSSVKGSTLPTFNLWLFKIKPAATNDNSALTLTDSDNDNVVCVIPLTNQYSAVNNARLEASLQQRIAVSLTSGLYGLLEVTNAYTPASGEIIKVTIKGYSI